MKWSNEQLGWRELAWRWIWPWKQRHDQLASFHSIYHSAYAQCRQSHYPSRSRAKRIINGCDFICLLSWRAFYFNCSSQNILWGKLGGRLFSASWAASLTMQEISSASSGWSETPFFFIKSCTLASNHFTRCFMGWRDWCIFLKRLSFSLGVRVQYLAWLSKCMRLLESLQLYQETAARRVERKHWHEWHGRVLLASLSQKISQSTLLTVVEWHCPVVSTTLFRSMNATYFPHPLSPRMVPPLVWHRGTNWWSGFPRQRTALSTLFTIFIKSSVDCKAEGKSCSSLEDAGRTLPLAWTLHA